MILLHSQLELNNWGYSRNYLKFLAGFDHNSSFKNGDIKFK